MDAATQEARQQLALMGSLRAFVDALRDIKDGETLHTDVVKAVRVLCGSPEAEWSRQQCREAVWKRGLVPLLQQLCACMERLDRIEAEQKAAQCAKISAKTAEAPKAPLGLLSLRDYSVLQAAVEILFCWGVYPRVDSGVLQPIDRRRPTRTLAISMPVLLWGGSAESGDDGDELLAIAQTMMQVLFLPQFQPILLPKYTVELLAILVFGEVKSGVRVATLAEFHRLRELMLRTLPLRLTMSSLRAALGQSAGRSAVVASFKQQCGLLLSHLSMEDGGLMTSIEMLLGAVDEGNTQARMQVVTLVCQCPSDVAPEKYIKSLCVQVRGLLSPSNRDSKLLCEMGVLLADRMASDYRDIFDIEFVSPIFKPLLLYEDSRAELADKRATGDEESIAECVAVAHLLLCGPPPSQHLLHALAPIIRPLVHMHAFAVNSKSFQRQVLQDILLVWIKLCDLAPLMLQLSVMPVSIPLPQTLLSCGYQRSDPAWQSRRKFCAGGSGGIAMRSTDAMTEEDIAVELMSVITPLLQLLTSKELETEAVVGDLFVSLLLTYMDVRRKTRLETNRAQQQPAGTSESAALDMESLYKAAAVPMSQVGVEMVLSLLLAVTEALGPAVLRSAESILRCIVTVLETYNNPAVHIVDTTDQTKAAFDDEDEEEGDEMLTICLGVVMTILEAGSTERSKTEEAQLRTMLPVLETLSLHSRPEVAELASDARVRILSREAVPSPPTAKHREKPFAQVLQEAEEDLKSTLVPLRARGVVSLTKLVRSSQQHRGDAEWTPRIQLLLKIFLQHLEDAESYVFLAAVQGLSTLSDIHPDVAIPLLVAALRDATRHSLQKRIKLSEALLFTAKRCGETLPKYANAFVFAYLDCIRPPVGQATRAALKTASKRVALIQEIDSDAPDQKPEVLVPSPQDTADRLEQATLRASCLSNLAEVCALLQWSVQPFALDVITCVLGILQLELESGSSTLIAAREPNAGAESSNASRGLPPPAPTPVIAVRRGAVFVLKYLIQLLGWKLLDIAPEQLRPVYHTLQHVKRVDHDSVVVFHAREALDALGQVMRSELFPRVDEQDEAWGISKLRIV